jgi:hypothetical protein
MLRKQDQEKSLDTKLMHGNQVVHFLIPNLIAERMECGTEPDYLLFPCQEKISNAQRVTSVTKNGENTCSLNKS